MLGLLSSDPVITRIPATVEGLRLSVLDKIGFISFPCFGWQILTEVLSVTARSTADVRLLLCFFFHLLFGRFLGFIPQTKRNTCYALITKSQ